MIPYIYDFSLESVNRAITDMNDALKRLSLSEDSSDSVSSNIVWREFVGCDVTEVFKDGLSIANDEIWDFSFHVFTNTAADISMYVNKNVTASNYKRVYIYSTNGAAVQAATDATAILMSSTGADEKITVKGQIIFVDKRNIVHIHYRGFRESDETSLIGDIRYTLPSPETDVYKLTIRASVAKAINKDSDFRIWKAYDN